MACNCINTLAETVVNELNQRESKPDGYKVLHTQWERMNSWPQRTLYANFFVKSSFRKKAGGESVPRNETFVLVFTFCPFCGKKYEE